MKIKTSGRDDSRSDQYRYPYEPTPYSVLERLAGSGYEKGCTWRALKEVADTLEKEGVESEILHIGKKPIGGCIGCGGCSKNNGRCVFNNDPVRCSYIEGPDAKRIPGDHLQESQ